MTAGIEGAIEEYIRGNEVFRLGVLRFFYAHYDTLPHLLSLPLWLMYILVF